MNHAEFGRYLRVWRKQANMPLYKVAEVLGVSTLDLFNYEAGLLPNADLLNQMGRLYGVDDALFTETLASCTDPECEKKVSAVRGLWGEK